MVLLSGFLNGCPGGTTGIKKANPSVRFFFVLKLHQGAAAERLSRNDVLSLRAFLALSNSKGYTLTFSQSFETSTGDGFEMCKHIRAAFTLDKTKTFCFVEPFYGAGDLIRHNQYSCIFSKVVAIRPVCWKTV